MATRMTGLYGADGRPSEADLESRVADLEARMRAARYFDHPAFQFIIRGQFAGAVSRLREYAALDAVPGGEMLQLLNSANNDVAIVNGDRRGSDSIIAAYESKSGELAERFEMKMSPEQKTWVLNNGGAAKVRELIERERGA